MNQKDLKELRKYCSAKNINVLTVYGAFVNENHQMENLFCQDLDAILDAPRAKAIYDGFSNGNASEPLCRRCGYASRFVP